MPAKATHDFDPATGAYTGKPERSKDLGAPEKPTGEHDFDATTGRYTPATTKASKKAAA